MNSTVLKIEGMTCDHCVHSIQDALSSVPGVRKAEVSLGQKKAVITSDGPIDVSNAIFAVEQEGYKASLIS
jgi:copper chaperone CopZ